MKHVEPGGSVQQQIITQITELTKIKTVGHTVCYISGREDNRGTFCLSVREADDPPALTSQYTMPTLPKIPYDGIKWEAGRPHFLLNLHPRSMLQP